MGIYLPPLDFMYAFESRVAAFTYGAAFVPFGVVTAYTKPRYQYSFEGKRGKGVCTSLATKKPAILSYPAKASITAVKA